MEKEIFDLTKKLVSFRTEKDSPEEIRKALEYLKQLLEESGVSSIKIEEHNGKLSLYAPPRKTEQEHVLLNGHIDVVDGEDEQYKSIEDQEYLYGRGSGDMKSGLAVLVLLCKKYWSAKNVALLVNSDEEMGGSNGARIYAEKLKPGAVIVTEPTDGKICVKEKGGLWIDINVKGPGGHASRPWNAKNAVDILMEIISKIKEKVNNPEKEAWVNTMNIGSIKGGSVKSENGEVVHGPGNIIALEASARLDIRLTEKTTHKEIISLIDIIISEKKEEIGEKYSVESDAFHKVAHLYTDENNEYVKKLCDAYEEATHRKPEFKKGHAASDGRFFSAKNIPVMLIGPKSIGHHSDNEKAEKKSIIETYKVIDKFLAKT